LKPFFWRSCLGACALIATITVPALATDFTFTSVIAPKEAGTQVRGFGPQGQLVGDYYDAKFTFHGFIESMNEFTPVNVKGATNTIVQAGSTSGYLVQASDNTGATTGYLLDTAGKFHRIAVPGALSTFPMGMNAAGTIVGYYFPSSGPIEAAAFTLANGKYTTFSIPNAYDTEFSGINDANVIAGSYRLNDSSYFVGFTSTKGKLTKIVVPHALSTSIQGINKLGEVVGYWSAGGVDTGFVFDGKTFSWFSPTGGTTYAWAIDDNGDVGGFTFRGSNEIGFIGKPKVTSIFRR
jgi:hypothetical protein